MYALKWTFYSNDKLSADDAYLQGFTEALTYTYLNFLNIKDNKKRICAKLDELGVIECSKASICQIFTTNPPTSAPTISPTMEPTTIKPTLSPTAVPTLMPTTGPPVVVAPTAKSWQPTTTYYPTATWHPTKSWGPTMTWVSNIVFSMKSILCHSLPSHLFHRNLLVRGIPQELGDLLNLTRTQFNVITITKVVHLICMHRHGYESKHTGDKKQTYFK